MAALLIYPFGNSDLQQGGWPVPREGPGDQKRPAGAGANREAFRDFCRRIGESCRPEWDEDRGLVWVSKDMTREHAGEPEVDMPLLTQALRFVTKQNDRETDRAVTIQPILTDQDPPHPSDTAPLRPLLGQFRDLKLGDVVINSLKPWIIKSNPADRRDTTRSYRRFWDNYEALAGDYSDRWYALGPGTPAMSYAATLFGRDPALEVLDIPWGSDPYTLNLWRDEERQKTDSLVAELGSRLELGAVATVLTKRWNGYTPVTGEPHPRGDDIALSVALAMWWRRSYRDAQAALDALPLKTAALTSFSQHLAALSERWTKKTDYQLASEDYIGDHLARLIMRRHSGVLSDAILELYTFDDAIQWWALAVALDDRTTDLRTDQKYREAKERRAALKEEAGIERLRSRLGDEGYGAYVAWTNLMMPTRGLRNQLTHGGSWLSQKALEKTAFRLKLPHPKPTVDDPRPVLDLFVLLGTQLAECISANSLESATAVCELTDTFIPDEVRMVRWLEPARADATMNKNLEVWIDTASRPQFLKPRRKKPRRKK